MSSTFPFREALAKEAMLEVAMDEVQVLRPSDARKMIFTHRLNGCTVLVIIGSGENDAILMAHIGPRAQPGMSSGSSSAGSPTQIKIPVTDGEKHFMKHARIAARALSSERRLSTGSSAFSRPVAFSIFGQYDGEVPLGHLRELLDTAFEHIGLKFTPLTYEVIPRNAARTEAKGTVVAVRMREGTPELYKEGNLVYPRDYTGALNVEMSRLKIGEFANEEGEEEEEDDDGDQDDDGEEDDDEESDDDEKGDDDEEKGDDDERDTSPTNARKKSAGPPVPQQARPLQRSAPSVANQAQQPPMGQRSGNSGPSTSSSADTRWSQVGNEYFQLDVKTNQVLHTQSAPPMNTPYSCGPNIFRTDGRRRYVFPAKRREEGVGRSASRANTTVIDGSKAR